MCLKFVWFKGCVIIVLLFRSTTAADRGPQAELTCWVKRRQGSAKPKRKQFFSSDFMKFFEKSINSSLKCFVSGKIEEKVRPLINLPNFVYWIIHEISLGAFTFMGSCQKLNNFYRCQKSLFYSFWISYLFCEAIEDS